MKGLHVEQEKGELPTPSEPTMVRSWWERSGVVCVLRSTLADRTWSDYAWIGEWLRARAAVLVSVEEVRDERMMSHRALLETYRVPTEQRLDEVA